MEKYLGEAVRQYPGWEAKTSKKRFTGTKVAIPAGFEPATHGVEIRYSIQLSYGTIRRPDRAAFIALPI
jgi:hypothetical protein